MLFTYINRRYLSVGMSGCKYLHKGDVGGETKMAATENVPPFLCFSATRMIENNSIVMINSLQYYFYNEINLVRFFISYIYVRYIYTL